MKTKTTRIQLTAEELDIICTALNAYSLEMMDKSETWATGEGEEDIYHRRAYEIGAIWVKTFKAKKRISE